MMNSTFKLMHVIGQLNDDQKQVVSNVGFSTILDLCCSSVPKNLVLWLADRFDTASNTVNLPNGLSFTINSAVVKSILGIPMSNETIPCCRNEEALSVYQTTIQFSWKNTFCRWVSVYYNTRLQGRKFCKSFRLVGIVFISLPQH